MTKTIAVPTVAGKACQHFGHCERFAIIEVADGAVTASCMVTPPEHQPGLYPRFLAEQGVTVVLAGGMGQKAQDLFQQQGIEVFMGMPPEEPTTLAVRYLQGNLESAPNTCDHGNPSHKPLCGEH